MPTLTHFYDLTTIYPRTITPETGSPTEEATHDAGWIRYKFIFDRHGSPPPAGFDEDDIFNIRVERLG